MTLRKSEKIILGYVASCFENYGVRQDQSDRDLKKIITKKQRPRSVMGVHLLVYLRQKNMRVISLEKHRGRRSCVEKKVPRGQGTQHRLSQPPDSLKILCLWFHSFELG